jgi:hypothetical protein
LARVTGDLGNNLGDLLDELLLTLSSQRRWRRDDLNPHGAGGVGGCGMNRVRIHSVDEGSGVVQMERTGGYNPFGTENGHSQLVTQPTVSANWEKV